MTEPTLRRLLHKLVAASLASPLSLVAVAGCGGSGLPDPAGFTLPACVPSGALAMDGMMPATAVDYLEMRQRDQEGPMTSRVLSSTGTQCKTATDVATCKSALAALPVSPSFHPCVDHECGASLATTAGDTVKSYNDAAAVQTLLGTIDTPQEAALTVFAAGYDISCTDKATGGVRAVVDGYEVLASKMTKICAPIEITGYLLKVDKSGKVTVQSSSVISSSPACVGRRPDGLCAVADQSAAGPVGDFLATAAHLEAASITAFRALRRELQAHRAPARLVRAAGRAAGDEIRHARKTTQLARRYGATTPSARVLPSPVRPLEAIALDNAVEGCVRETFGALVGLYQAGAAQDPQIARAMTTIAADELRHAELAWQVARWASRRLSPAARQRVQAARNAAVAALRSEVSRPVPTELVTLAGLPTPAVALQLVEQLAQSLWA